jgi:hypothetical protein
MGRVQSCSLLPLLLALLLPLSLLLLLLALLALLALPLMMSLSLSLVATVDIQGTNRRRGARDHCSPFQQCSARSP